ncbi:hypothetical protein MTR_5g025460 [Medicago truncatula]|uniref:Uncharacterized protein n=1 Tax=Medicago truncatula TaxID=3880 RepID=G7K405_MEDTR|nr:hypothetical protein MTR_5g025460 [Medicago truncatula]
MERGGNGREYFKFVVFGSIFRRGGRGRGISFLKLRLVKFVGFIETKCVYLKRRKVGSLQVFYLALLRKWCWRLRREKDEFWCHLSAHKHGLLIREVVRESITNSIWWKNIFRIMRGDVVRYWC